MRAFRFIPLKDILQFEYPVYAHIELNKPNETLIEHTKLCEKYYTAVYTNRNVEEFIQRFLATFPCLENEECRNLYIEMLDNVIVFHDTGKLNPEFQIKKMKNVLPPRYKVDWLQGTRHSMFSSVIYLNYFMLRIEESGLLKQQKRVLQGLCLIHAFVIARHHSDMNELMVFINEFKDGGAANSIFDGLKANGSFLVGKIYNRSLKFIGFMERFLENLGRDDGIAIYTYTRFLYSVLVSSDYYATTEYTNGVCIKDFSIDNELAELADVYNDTERLKDIRTHQENMIKKNCALIHASDINALRNEIFLEAEKRLQENPYGSIYYLDAPTGGGKSNVALNLSFQFIQSGLKKIYYIYPFNTLVEQNLENLADILKRNEKLLQKITVINSYTPIKSDKSKSSEEENSESYIKALLDRQFLNYPIILTTHVSFFRTLFGEQREDIFGFSQLQDSIIVLDEIQSYKNLIWSEIITFFNTFAPLLNMKFIIMSATLPKLDYLIDHSGGFIHLLPNSERYFMNPFFKERVSISYELLDRNIDFDQLKEHIISQMDDKQKIMIEFINKGSAYKFMNDLSSDPRIKVPLYLITGDDNRYDRSVKINELKKNEEKAMIVVATQVIEAGVDIDMDIGYKDISKLDSEEQFMGRINRSCSRSGRVYFFNLDNARKIYGDSDYRINTELTLQNEEMREILENKEFWLYYKMVMTYLKEFKSSGKETNNLSVFFSDEVTSLNFPTIALRMNLIDDNDWYMSVFLSRRLHMENRILDGKQVWKNYVDLLNNDTMEYSKKQVSLSEVRSDMDYFIYQICINHDLNYNENIGDLYYFEDGDKFFVDGRLYKDKFKENGFSFID